MGQGGTIRKGRIHLIPSCPFLLPSFPHARAQEKALCQKLTHSNVPLLRLELPDLPSKGRCSAIVPESRASGELACVALHTESPSSTWKTSLSGNLGLLLLEASEMSGGFNNTDWREGRQISGMFYPQESKDRGPVSRERYPRSRAQCWFSVLYC